MLQIHSIEYQRIEYYRLFLLLQPQTVATRKTDEWTTENGEAPYIPLYIYISVSLVNAIIFLVGTVGNILVIIVILKVRDMRTPTNVFLLNLSLADVLVLFVCQPAALLEFFGKDRWFLGEFMCKLVFHCDYTNLTNMVLLTVWQTEQTITTMQSNSDSMSGRGRSLIKIEHKLNDVS